MNVNYKHERMNPSHQKRNSLLEDVQFFSRAIDGTERSEYVRRTYVRLKYYFTVKVI